MSSRQSRIEKDSIGEVEIRPHNALFGSQTARSLQNFKIGDAEKEKMPLQIIASILQIKRAAALTNCSYGKISNELAKCISLSAEEILNDQKLLQEAFPLLVWQTGSGTQTNMNANEVIANYANVKFFKSEIGSKNPIHPNDHVNMSQSSNDVFPTAMHVCAYKETKEMLKYGLNPLAKALKNKSDEFQDIVKIGRTHCQDAVPMRVGDEFSAFFTNISNSISNIEQACKKLEEIPIGGTAVGTGINAYKEFGQGVCDELNKIFTDKEFEFKPGCDKFALQSSKTAITNLHASFATLATDLMKIVNDIRMLASGPNCGFGEIILPSNEPGSSIMPGKVNPTQCEMVSMVAAQILGNNCSILTANSFGHFQLNAFMPLIIRNFLHSATLIKDSTSSLANNCIKELKLNMEKIKMYTESSPMLVTALNPKIGYDKSSKIVKYSAEKKISLKRAASELKLVDENKFDKIVDPKKMSRPY